MFCDDSSSIFLAFFNRLKYIREDTLREDERYPFFKALASWDIIHPYKRIIKSFLHVNKLQNCARYRDMKKKCNNLRHYKMKIKSSFERRSNRISVMAGGRTNETC